MSDHVTPNIATTYQTSTMGPPTKSHPDANQETASPWKDLNTGKSITQRIMPVDHDTLTNLRKHLPPDKACGKNVQGQYHWRQDCSVASEGRRPKYLTGESADSRTESRVLLTQR